MFSLGSQNSTLRPQTFKCTRVVKGCKILELRQRKQKLPRRKYLLDHQGHLPNFLGQLGINQLFLFQWGVLQINKISVFFHSLIYWIGKNPHWYAEPNARETAPANDLRRSLSIKAAYPDRVSRGYRSGNLRQESSQVQSKIEDTMHLPSTAPERRG